MIKEGYDINNYINNSMRIYAGYYLYKTSRHMPRALNTAHLTERNR